MNSFVKYQVCGKVSYNCKHNLFIISVIFGGSACFFSRCKKTT